MICRSCGELVADGPVCEVCGHDPVNRSGGKIDWRPFVIVGGLLGAILLSIVAAILMAVVGGVSGSGGNGRSILDPDPLAWQTDYDAAFAEAKEKDRAVLLRFEDSGTYGPFLKQMVDRRVFEDPKFIRWAEDRLVLLELDRPTEQQDPDRFYEISELMDTHGVRGGGIFLFLTHDGEELGRLDTKSCDEASTFVLRGKRILGER